MASIVNRPNGHRWICFAGPNGRRQTIRLGKAPKTLAAAFKDRIERLLAATVMNVAPDLDTARWVGGLSPHLHARLAAAGLAEGRQVVTLGDLLEDFAASIAVEPGTEHNHETVARNLCEHFGRGRRIDRITRADAATFCAWLTREGGDGGAPLAPATVSRRVGRAKQAFKHAVNRKWLRENPFVEEGRGNEANRDRDFSVVRELIEKVTDEATNAEFRAILALARWGGLRCPSEVLPMRWEQVDWSAATLLVKARKTRRHADRSERLIPLFVEIRDALEPLWTAAEEGQPLLFPRHHQMTGAGLTKELGRCCLAAGVPLWPKPFQNMRATRETELLEEFPLHVVVGWLGHSPTVSRKHYAQVTREHFQRAVMMGESADNVKRKRKRRTAP